MPVALCEYYRAEASHCLRQPLNWMEAVSKWLCPEHEARVRARLNKEKKQHGDALRRADDLPG